MPEPYETNWIAWNGCPKTEILFRPSSVCLYLRSLQQICLWSMDYAEDNARTGLSRSSMKCLGKIKWSRTILIVKLHLYIFNVFIESIVKEISVEYCKKYYTTILYFNGPKFFLDLQAAAYYIPNVFFRCLKSVENHDVQYTCTSLEVVG